MRKEYLDLFSPNNLEKAYKELKSKKITTGTDHISKKKFDTIYNNAFLDLYPKIESKSYKPSSYREVLLMKNRDSKPRALSLPTIKDKVVLSILRKILHDNFVSKLELVRVEDIIKNICQTIISEKYDYCIKIDITNYYGSIKHKLLLEKVSKFVNYDIDLLELIDLFLKNKNISEDGKKSYHITTGVPQGISISNILGNIYLNDFDYEMLSLDCKYYRYVDDILIFCHKNDSNFLFDFVKNHFKPLYLKLNNRKVTKGVIDNIDFLGYNFNKDGIISISVKNIKKLERSLDKIFIEYKSSQNKRVKNNIKLLKWKIDFRITGCVKDDRRFGWVIYFNLNQDEKIMHHLDWYIVKLAKKYRLEDELLIKNQYIGKRFVKTYHEFKGKRDYTDYIPNINKYTKEEKQNVLIDICNRNRDRILGLSDFFLEREFQRFIFSSIRDIEMDLNQIYT